MLNHIDLIGRLGRDPEMRQTGSGTSVCNFSIAVDRDFKDKATGERLTDWFDIVAWRATADFVSKYFRKGDNVGISGRLQSRKWQDKDGNNRVAIEVQADNVYFCGGKNGSDSAPATANTTDLNSYVAVPEKALDIEPSDDIPF